MVQGFGVLMQYGVFSGCCGVKKRGDHGFFISSNGGLKKRGSVSVPGYLSIGRCFSVDYIVLECSSVALLLTKELASAFLNVLDAGSYQIYGTLKIKKCFCATFSMHMRRM